MMRGGPELPQQVENQGGERRKLALLSRQGVSGFQSHAGVIERSASQCCTSQRPQQHTAQ